MISGVYENGKMIAAKAASEERRLKRKNRRKNGRGKRLRGFARGKRKTGQPDQQIAPVRTIMRNGNPAGASKEECNRAIRESKDNLSRKLETLRVKRIFDQDVVRGSETVNLACLRPPLVGSANSLTDVSVAAEPPSRRGDPTSHGHPAVSRLDQPAGKALK